MAARKRRIEVSDEWREKLAAAGQATMLMKRLCANALGTLDPPMTQGEIRSAEVVLKKIVPDLSAIEQTTDVNIHYVARVPNPQPEMNEWQRQHADALKNTTKLLQ